MCGDQQRAAVPHRTGCVTNGSWLPRISCSAFVRGTTTLSTKTSSSLLLDGPWRHILSTGHPAAIRKEPGWWGTGTCPPGPWPHPLSQPLSLCLPLPVEKVHENTSPPWDVSPTLWWKLWFQSAPTQCKNLQGSVTHLFPNIIIWQVVPQEQHTNLLSQRFAQSPKLAVKRKAQKAHCAKWRIAPCHFPAVGLFATKMDWPKKKNFVFLSAFQESASALMHPDVPRTPVCSELNFTHHINKQIKQKSP